MFNDITVVATSRPICTIIVYVSGIEISIKLVLRIVPYLWISPCVFTFELIEYGLIFGLCTFKNKSGNACMLKINCLWLKSLTYKLEPYLSRGNQTIKY